PDNRGPQEDRDQDDRDRESLEHLVRDAVVRGGIRVIDRNRGGRGRPIHVPEERHRHHEEERRGGEDDEELARVHGAASVGGSSMILRRVSMIPKTNRTGTAPAYTKIWIRKTNSLRNR